MNRTFCHGIAAKLIGACRSSLWLFAVILPLTVFAQSVESAKQTYEGRPPFSAEEFWKKILLLINDRSGTVTKEEVEDLFGVKFTNSSGSKQKDHYVLYHLTSPRDWYFGMTVGEFTDQYTDPVEPEIAGAHSLWRVGWRLTAFGDPAKGECIVAGKVRADLVNSGWIAPVRWGNYDTEEPESVPDCVKSFRCSPTLRIPSGNVYFKKSLSQVFPRVHILSGNAGLSGLSTACLTGIDFEGFLMPKAQ